MSATKVVTGDGELMLPKKLTAKECNCGKPSTAVVIMVAPAALTGTSANAFPYGVCSPTCLAALNVTLGDVASGRTTVGH